MRNLLAWVGELLACVALFGSFYLIIWFAAIVYPEGF
tara:strand:- start:1024 stop:1134 length:111 start_codon:yes stop_codon:yes gene_type:complete